MKILIKHNLAGMTAKQLRELVDSTNDLEALRLLRDYLAPKGTKWAGEIAERCVSRAKEIHWQTHGPAIKDAFMHKILDPFVDVVEWLL
jgi:hypothetical protein